MDRELALVLSGASGMALAARFATLVAEHERVQKLHLVLTAPACTVLGHELGSSWASPQGFVEQLPVAAVAREKLQLWKDNDLMAPVSSGSHALVGTVMLPCSAGMVGALANGISRGLAQRVGDVALKQGWPLLVAVRETPMSTILLHNLHQLALAGARIVPPLPAFYLRPEPAEAVQTFIDHYCLRLLDLLGLPLQQPELRWRS